MHVIAMQDQEPVDPFGLRHRAQCAGRRDDLCRDDRIVGIVGHQDDGDTGRTPHAPTIYMLLAYIFNRRILHANSGHIGDFLLF